MHPRPILFTIGLAALGAIPLACSGAGGAPRSASVVDADSGAADGSIDAPADDSTADAGAPPTSGVVPVDGLDANATTLTGSLGAYHLSRPASVLTQHGDVSRTGANVDEQVLDTTSVSADSFGLLFSRAVEGQIYAQPLYVPRVSIPSPRGAPPVEHAVVFVATEHDDVYAFDADDPAESAPLWHVHLGEPVPTGELITWGFCHDLAPEIGITSTPTIDLASGTLYVETKEKLAGAYAHRLHALELATGKDKPGSPVVITAELAGTGDGAVDGTLSFDPLRENNRAGLLLSHGVLWIAFAGHCDITPYHGWVLAYDATTLMQLGAWTDTLDSGGGGIWMSGQGLAADDAGDVYFVSGNGTFIDGAEVSDSIGRLHLEADGTISLVDSFTPFNETYLGSYDLDLGSSGALLIPDHDWLVGGGKEGKLYVLDRNAMGGFHDGDDSQILESFQATAPPAFHHHLHGAPVYWRGPSGGRLYLWGTEDTLRVFAEQTVGFDPTPVQIGTVVAPTGIPGGVLTLSADGSSAGSGIVWSSMPSADDASSGPVHGVLRALDAADVTRELWNSALHDRDDVGLFAKFTPPTVANGRVYLATFSGQLRVYGLLSPAK